VGNVIEKTDGNGHIYRYEVNVHDQIIRTLSPFMESFVEDGGAQYETIAWFDANGNVEKEWTELRDAYEYDGLNQRIKAQTLTSGVGVSEGSIITYQRDNRNLVLQSSQEIWDPFFSKYHPVKSFDKTYDALENPLTMGYPGGRQVTYSEYNALEQVGVVETNGFSGANPLQSYEYHGLGRPVRLVKGNGSTLEVEYDAIQRIQSFNHYQSNPSQLSLGFTQTYNKVNSLREQRSLDEINGVEESRIYEMDAYQRVIGHVKNLPVSLSAQALNEFSSISPANGENHEVVTYDARNNTESLVREGVSQSFSHNEMNELTAVSGEFSSITYDEVGRMTSYIQGVDQYQLFWNARDQLLSVEKNGQEVVAYEYYPGTSMRCIKFVNGVSENYYGCGDSIHEIYSVDSLGMESTFPVKEFIYEAKDTPLAFFTDADNNATSGALNGREAYFYHQNPRGDLYALSNQNGEIVERYDYSLFGEVEVFDPAYNPVPSAQSQYGNPFLFGGVYYDAEIELN
jgi:hypothetical protein